MALMEIEIIQYMRPGGIPTKKTTDIPQYYAEAYQAMKAAGCRLAAEVLTTNEVAIYVENEIEDIDMKVVPNGPKVHIALCQLLERRSWENVGAD